MAEQKYIYVAFVRSNTAAGAIIRKITGWSYSHVSVSLNRKTGKFYAFSRLNCGSPFWAGFTQEYRSNYTLLKDKPVEITYYKIPVTVEELKKVKAFIYMLSQDKEYIFNYPSMVTTTILHGFRMYKSYNCVTFVSKILSFLNSVELKKKYYKYDLMELEEAVSSFRDGSEKVCINHFETPNPFFHKMGFRSCRREEFGLVAECCYRLLFGRSSKKYRPAGVRHFMNFTFHFTRTGDVKIYTVPEITALLRQNGFAVTSKEQQYSGFLCVALNDKKANGDR